MNRYLAFLNNYDIRPCKAQYLWWFYYLQDHLPETYFVVNEDYMKVDPNRWEVAKYETAPYKYRNPKELHPKNYSILRRINEYPELKSEKIPSKILKKAMTEPLPFLTVELDKILESEKDIVAAIVWCNNASLEYSCKHHNIPVIHNESGGIRSPWFKDTCYFDFGGVNGNTEFDKRYKEFRKIAHKVKILPREELLRIITPEHNQEYLFKMMNTTPTYDCGVALQVDVDTNLLTFNKEVQETDVVNLAVKRFKKVVVRNHPLSSLGYIRPASLGLGEVDNSKNAWEFISKCEWIYTLNSSTAFEAFLLGKKAVILGDNPFYSLQYWNDNPEEMTLALNFAIFSYLMPTKRLYDEGYYTFRLNCEDEEEIYNEGQKYWLENM